MSTISTQTSTAIHCEKCGGPVAADQRYCLNCGAHIREVPDPVARYLSEASAARARIAAALARSTTARRARKLPSVSGTSALVLVIIALLVGVAIGHASSNGSGRSSTSATRVTTTTNGSGSGATNDKGRSAVSKVATSKGKSYVQQENNLPTSVTP